METSKVSMSHKPPLIPPMEKNVSFYNTWLSVPFQMIIPHPGKLLPRFSYPISLPPTFPAYVPQVLQVISPGHKSDPFTL
jgi:hypothetical protein